MFDFCWNMGVDYVVLEFVLRYVHESYEMNHENECDWVSQDSAIKMVPLKNEKKDDSVIT